MKGRKKRRNRERLVRAGEEGGWLGRGRGGMVEGGSSRKEKLGKVGIEEREEGRREE